MTASGPTSFPPCLSELAFVALWAHFWLLYVETDPQQRAIEVLTFFFSKYLPARDRRRRRRRRRLRALGWPSSRPRALFVPHSFLQ